MRQPLQRGMTGLERKGEDEIATEWNGNETEVILCDRRRTGHGWRIGGSYNHLIIRQYITIYA